MTSATGKTRALKLRAFTLLEVVLTIGILMLLVGILVPLVSAPSQTRALQNFAEDFSILAREARLQAMKTGYPTAMILTETGASIRSANLMGGEDIVAGEAPAQTLVLPAGAVLEWRGWRDGEFRAVGERGIWTFQPNGLCEPISVRIADGESWIEQTFSALTAEVVEERYALR